ncbi:HugZ family protein [Thalassococcus sp. S3]|uniref:HugZ family pyridoxamine 5'-phosphate oxidase n=1 Tax=Thalassococcus sp. S3 TaxID=2017482 RepID=UPI001024676D|nr:pyridoxamine 5'-phosphate oxidase family protein [Thalassococcus sp. S3]QBF30293.1 pyridoxamine 5-phosphate oxidase [Thalassococcus sp. S3]
MSSPIRPTDEEARRCARDLVSDAKIAALGVLDPAGAPLVTRIGFGRGTDNRPVSLMSRLSGHTQALLQNPACSLLVGEAVARGDPLNQPRLSLQGRARLVAHGTDEYRSLAEMWLKHYPKAKLYIGFTDFVFAVFDIDVGHLNGGFGKAFRLTPSDMDMPAKADIS